MDYKVITECRCCGGSKLQKFIDFGEQPLANAFHTLAEPTALYPLAANVCLDCWHSQLTVVVNPDILFKHYLYISGISQTFKDYCEWFATYTFLMRAGISFEHGGTCKVLDIACNDGTLLDEYKKLGCDTYGIDPAKNITPIANYNHSVLTGYWPDLSYKVVPKSIDIIVAQNVFAHVDNILDFLLSCKDALVDNGLLFIQTSQANMFKNGEFDTIYHEHLSFFNTKSMRAICERAGLVLNQIQKTNIHGTSYVFCIGKTRMVDFRFTNVEDAIYQEEIDGLYDTTTYTNFSMKMKRTISDLKTIVEKYKLDGYKIIGYGAAAKGMTVLNAGSIDLDCIVDDNPMKQGLLSPGMDIPIKSRNMSEEYHAGEPIVIIPLAWNFYDEIRKKIATYRTKKDIYIKYFPKISIEN